MKSVPVALMSFACVIALSSTTRGEDPSPDRLLAEARPEAIRQLLLASRGADPYLRANAIEAMSGAPDRVLPMCELGLRDEHPVVRFAALVTLGKMQARSQVKAAERMTGDPNPSVRAAAYFAAKRCGSPINVSPMGALLMSDDPDVRANTAMLLGLMGDESAGPMLVDAGRSPMPRVSDVKVLLVRCQIAEARVRLGEYEAIDAIRAGSFSSYPEVRMICVGLLGDLGDVQNMEDALLSIYRDSQEVLELRLATAAALVRYGRPVVVKEVLDDLPTVLGAAKMGEPTFRGQAATTLGAIERARARVRPQLLETDPPAIREQFVDPAATEALIELLGDPDPRVRVAAAAGVVWATQQ